MIKNLDEMTAVILALEGERPPAETIAAGVSEGIRAAGVTIEGRPGPQGEAGPAGPPGPPGLAAEALPLPLGVIVTKRDQLGRTVELVKKFDDGSVVVATVKRDNRTGLMTEITWGPMR
jgi:hypothetical protein